MICLLLIMMVIFVNGIQNAEQKIRHSDSILKQEEMDAKTRDWLLMVESGKVDEEEIRRITPKSIFIAPLLAGNRVKCKDGYRHDHLGQCVKVIKLDPKIQLELLLKRLNTIYSEKKSEEKELPEVSNEPLHFSIPISNEDKSKMKTTSENSKLEVEKVNANSTETKNPPELVPIPLPVVLLNQTHEINQTKEIESSGSGPLNETGSYLSIPFEGSGFASGDAPPEDEDSSSISLLPEESDYIYVKGTDTTTDILSATETTTPPTETKNSTESYQSITDELSINDSAVNLPKENVTSSEYVTKHSKSDIISFPSEEVRTQNNLSTKSFYVRFPDEPPQSQVYRYHVPQPVPTWNSQHPVIPSSIPHQQFWWPSENWKVDNSQQKSPLIKFWSRLPLIHDVSFSDRGDVKKHSEESITSSSNSQHRSNDFTVNFNHQLPNRKGHTFRINRFYHDSVAVSRER